MQTIKHQTQLIQHRDLKLKIILKIRIKALVIDISSWEGKQEAIRQIRQELDCQ